jgi:hypothetical protein
LVFTKEQNMSKILAALVAAVCMLTLSSVAQPATAAPSQTTVKRGGGDSWCC